MGGNSSRAALYWEGVADGGSEAVLSRVATAWQSAGNEALLASCGAGPSPLGVRWGEKGGRYVNITAETAPGTNSTLTGPADFPRWWRRLLLREKPRVVLANDGGYPWHLTCLRAVREARVVRVPRVVLAIHSTPEAGGHEEDQRRADETVARACDAIVVGSPTLARIVACERPALAGKLRVIRYGVADPGAVNAPARARANPVRMGLACELRGSRKGQHVLLEALRRLDLPSNEWELSVAGDGDYGDELRRRVVEFGPQVRLLGRLSASEMSEFYRGLDLYVLPSLQEGLSLTVLEAMSHGLPVVTTDVGGHGDAVIDGITGCLVPAGDAGALAGALSYLCRDRSARLHRGAGGRRRYEEMFTLEAYLDSWLQLLLGGGGT